MNTTEGRDALARLRLKERVYKAAIVARENHQTHIEECPVCQDTGESCDLGYSLLRESIEAQEAAVELIRSEDPKAVPRAEPEPEAYSKPFLKIV